MLTCPEILEIDANMKTLLTLSCCFALVACVSANGAGHTPFFHGRWQLEPFFDCARLTEAADVSRAQCEQLVTEMADVRLLIDADTIELRGKGFDEAMRYTVEMQEADTATLRIDKRQIMHATREDGRLCLREAGIDSAQCYRRANDAD